MNYIPKTFNLYKITRIKFIFKIIFFSAIINTNTSLKIPQFQDFQHKRVPSFQAPNFHSSRHYHQISNSVWISSLVIVFYRPARNTIGPIKLTLSNSKAFLVMSSFQQCLLAFWSSYTPGLAMVSSQIFTSAQLSYELSYTAKSTPPRAFTENGFLSNSSNLVSTIFYRHIRHGIPHR